jgi:putative ATPase
MTETPLAVKLRPHKFEDVVGQNHLVGPKGIFYKMAHTGKMQHVLLWGPPGSGKTTIAYALAAETGSDYRHLNATTSGIKDLRKVLAFAEKNDSGTVVAVDEIHRWSKNVQDALLAAVENGTITLIGLTVETARFAVIKALLSRCLILETKPIDNPSLVKLYKKVRDYYKDQGREVKIEKSVASKLLHRVSGDARKLILVMETLIEIMSNNDEISEESLELVMPNKHSYCDANGSEHFDLAHCYQEAIQHSQVDEAIYWLAKWLESGEDPAYICRRMIITAFEDCAGNPFAATTAMAAHYATERTGMPECMIPMATATCEMAMSKRNKSAYYAIKDAMRDVQHGETIYVPKHLRAGTSGYKGVLGKTYLKGWSKDWEALDNEEEPSASGVAFAIGEGDPSGDHGFVNGPNPNLNAMLECIGDDGQFIAQLGDDSMHVLYKWRDGEWKTTRHVTH